MNFFYSYWFPIVFGIVFLAWGIYWSLPHNNKRDIIQPNENEPDVLNERIQQLNCRLSFIEGYLGLRLTNDSSKPVLEKENNK